MKASTRRYSAAGSADDVRRAVAGRAVPRILGKLCLAVILALLAALSVGPAIALTGTVVETRAVWGAAQHNAFTTLARFQDHWFLAFREGPEHGVPGAGKPPGQIRVLRSADSEAWSTAAVLSAGRDWDLRDPKLTIMPNGRLMLISMAAPRGPQGAHRSMVWTSGDGDTWDGGRWVGDPAWPLWDHVWKDGEAHATAYQAAGVSRQQSAIRLYRSRDGLSFRLIEELNLAPALPSEAAVLVRRDGSGVMLVRDENRGQNSLIGLADGSLRNWTFKRTGIFVGGPALRELPTGEVVAGGRVTKGQRRTSLLWVDPAKGTLTEFLRLPSGGDTGYPGLAWFDDHLWVSYYSSHEGKAKVYLAKIKLSDQPPARRAKAETRAPKVAVQPADPRREELRRRLESLLQKRAELATQYTNKHPDVKSVDREIGAVREGIKKLEAGKSPR